jgi:hypothetical protein
MVFPEGRRRVASTWRWARFFFGGFLVMADWPSRLRLARMKLTG